MYSYTGAVPCYDIADKLGIKKGSLKNRYHCFNTSAHNHNDDNPSLLIYKRHWKCLGCGIGDKDGHFSENIELVQAVKKCSVDKAKKWIREHFIENINQNTEEKQASKQKSDINKLQLRHISKSSKFRYEFRSPDELHLEDPTADDIAQINNTLEKSYTLSTLKKADIKINRSNLTSRKGYSYDGYAMVFPVGTESWIYNPAGLDKYIYVEGRTDALTAIEMLISEDYGIISQFNKTAEIKIYGEKAIFILDCDVNEEDLIKKFVFDRPFSAKFLRLPAIYKDLSEFYNDYEVDEQIQRTIPNTKLDIYDLAEKQKFKTFHPVVKFWIESSDIITIDRLKLIKFLESNGFFKVKIFGNQPIYIRNVNNIIERIEIDNIKDFVRNYIENLELECDEKDKILNSLLTGVRQYFAKDFIECIKSIDSNFEKHKKEFALFYFENCCVKVTADDINLIPFKNLDHNVWKERIILHDFKLLDDYTGCEYEAFIKNISNFNERRDRFRSIKTAIGYLLHDFKDRANSIAIILVDEKIPIDINEANGGTGKGIFCNALKELKNTRIKDGKNFKPDNNFIYQEIDIDTEILIIDDVKRKFPFSSIFSIITEDWVVEKKFKSPFTIPFEQSPKIIITSNHTITGQGVSYERRKFEIEFADYYKKDFTPFDEFGHYLFDGWNENEFNRFFNFMFRCCQEFLKDGLIPYEMVTLRKRKLIDSTTNDFVEFTEENIKKPMKIPKNDLFEKFQIEYTDYDKMRQNTFTKWVRRYTEYKNWSNTDFISNSVRYYDIS